MTATRAIHESIEPVSRTLSIRDAATATGTSVRSIRRRLAARAFPGAYKGTDPSQPDTVIWLIPESDLEAAGLGPLDLTTAMRSEISSSVVSAPAPTAGVLIGTDRFARLRSALAEAVASAELALLRAEAEKWRAVADERGHALERADFALQTLSSALALPDAEAVPETAPVVDTGPVVDERAVPLHIRSEAVLYAESMSARGGARTPRPSWWRRRR
jgi:hypothetical protein